MTCAERHELFELFSLGALEQAEQSDLEEHLARGCETCERSFQEAVAMNAVMLGLGSEQGNLPSPSKKLRRRVLTGVGLERSGWGWLGALAAAGLAVIAVFLATQERDRTNELANTRQDLLRTAAERDRLAQALSILDQPETKQVSFGKDKPQPPRGNVFLNSKLGVMLFASNLPKLAPGKAYEMWLIPKGGSPRPAGLFQSNEQQSAIHLVQGPVDTEGLGAVAVSVEPEAGSPAPTTQPIIVAGV
jgi:anti-sigma-K factor RskA